MRHNRMITYLLGAAAIAAVLVVAGVPLAGFLPFAVLLACPLMMMLMMWGMAGSHGEDHTGHGCEHDPTRKVEPPPAENDEPPHGHHQAGMTGTLAVDRDG